MGYVHAVPWYGTCMELEDNLLNSVLDIELNLSLVADTFTCWVILLLSQLAFKSCNPAGLYVLRMNLTNDLFF